MLPMKGIVAVPEIDSEFKIAAIIKENCSIGDAVKESHRDYKAFEDMISKGKQQGYSMYF
jgi:hypothetical protein